MLEPLQSEPFQTYAAVVVATVVLGSHVVIYLLSIVGLLLRPFSRILWDFSRRRHSSLAASAVVFLYPWIHLWGKPPRDITRTPFRPSKLLLIHTLWFINSVGLWVASTLAALVGALNELFPDVLGLDVYDLHGLKMPAWIGFTVLGMYTGAFALWSSLVWFGSLRRSLAHFKYMNGVEFSGDFDDTGHYWASHYWAPFRKATKWAFMTLPIYIGLLVLVVLVFPPWQG